MDPYVLLNVRRNCTEEELKTSFKRMSKKVHPDRGGDEHLFKLLTDAFRKLMVETRTRAGDATHMELKRGYERATTNDRTPHAGAGAGAGAGASKSALAAPPRMFATRDAKENARRFNKFFEENRFESDENDGYGAQMTAAPGTGDRSDIEAPQTYAGPFSRNRFNETFETRVAPPSEQRVAVYDDLSSAQGGSFQMSTLDGRRPVDFSGANGNLQYVDYMKAHSSARLVNPSTVGERPVYRNVEDLERARSRTLQFTPSEMAGYAQVVERRRQIEGEEVRAIRERDDALERYHARMEHLLTMRR